MPNTYASATMPVAKIPFSSMGLANYTKKGFIPPASGTVRPTSGQLWPRGAK